jgi:polysaccharide export outer membrane protein
MAAAQEDWGKLAEDLGKELGTGDRFKLGPGDQLEISVWKEEALTKTIAVRPDGYISFPLIGDVRAQGRTVQQLSDEIKEKIGEYVPDVPVTVILTNLGSTRVFVIGKVNSPGVFMLTQETRMMQLLSMAGGFNPFADEEDIRVLRYVDGDPVYIEFDYEEVAEGGDVSQNIVLEPGDVIIVP